jgi:heparin binding hemagglutinin HbhA
MAKKSRQEELFDMLRARGLRTRVARSVSDAVGAGRGAGTRGQKTVESIIKDLRGLADELEDRITGRSSTRKVAAQKAARTRARKATARSAAAKKGAATRAKKSGTSTTSRAKSTTTRAAKSATTRAKTTARRASSAAKK